MSPEEFDWSTLHEVKKVGGFIQVSDEVLMDQGVIPDTRPPYRSSWRVRWSLKWWDWRERLGEKIAGRKFDDLGPA
jgi:hypothetical protein